MAAKKPGRAASQESTETTGAAEAPTPEMGAGAAVGGTGARSRGARKAASAGAGSGGAAEEGSAGGTRPRARVSSKTGRAGAAGGTSDAAADAARSGAAEADAPSSGAGARPRGRAGGSKAGGAKAGAKVSTSAGGGRRGAKAAAGESSADSQLQSNLRAFVEHHPEGWGHHDWEGLLNHLSNSGLDTSDTARIGQELEKERVVHTLEKSGASGLRGGKARGIADRFGTLHSLREASVDDLASVSGITRAQAEKIHQSLR